MCSSVAQQMKAFEKFSALSVAVGFGLSAPVVWAADTSKSALEAQAKTTETDARATALAKVPGGVVQSAELENEHGKLVWSFDIKHPRSPNVIEVQVDAKTGAVVSKKTESPLEQAKEAKADKTARP